MSCDFHLVGRFGVLADVGGGRREVGILVVAREKFVILPKYPYLHFPQWGEGKGSGTCIGNIS